MDCQPDVLCRRAQLLFIHSARSRHFGDVRRGLDVRDVVHDELADKEHGDKSVLHDNPPPRVGQSGVAFFETRLPLALIGEFFPGRLARGAPFFSLINLPDCLWIRFFIIATKAAISYTSSC